MAAYGAATLDDVELGRAWYPSAYRVAEQLSARYSIVDPSRAAAVIAALSPQTRWRQNVTSAKAVLAAVAEDRPVRGAVGWGANIDKATRIARGAPLSHGPGDAFGGEAPKVRNFWQAIIGNPRAVTLDVWTMRAALGRMTVPTPKRALYRRGSGWFVEAAAIVGESPRDLQSIVWASVRPASEHSRDHEASRFYFLP